MLPHAGDPTDGQHTESPHGPQREATMPTLRSWTYGLQNWGTVSFCCYSMRRGGLCYGSLSTLMWDPSLGGLRLLSLLYFSQPHIVPFAPKLPTCISFPQEVEFYQKALGK